MKKSAIYSFAFEKEDNPQIILRTNAKGDLIWANKALSGYEIYNGIKHYFYLEFDQDPLSVSSLDWEKICAKSISFDSSVKEIKVRYGISYISVEQARKNFERRNC